MLTRSIVNRSTQLAEIQREQAEFMIGLGPRWNLTADEDMRFDIDRTIAGYQQEQLYTELQIMELNIQTAAELASMLPEQTANELQDAYTRSSIHDCSIRMSSSTGRLQNFLRIPPSTRTSEVQLNPLLKKSALICTAADGQHQFCPIHCSFWNRRRCPPQA